MSLPLDNILAYKDPASFRTHPVVVSRVESGVYTLDMVSRDIDFGQMSDYRSQGTSDCAVAYGILGAGHVFANLGVSAALTLTIDGARYLLAVCQQRHVGDEAYTAVKLPSGYVEAPFLIKPEQAIVAEISEEILALTRDGKHIRLAVQGHEVVNPYSSCLEDSGHTVPLTPAELSYNVSGFRSPIRIGGEELSGHHAFYFHLPSNSMQLVFGYDAEFDPASLSALFHAEDHFEPATKNISVRVDREGIYLFRLEEGRITGDIFTFLGGELRSVHPDISARIFLSEAFSPHIEGRIKRVGISLADFLRQRGGD